MNTTGESRRPLKVAFVYHYIAHYREPVFKALARSEELDVTVISGTETNMNIELTSPTLASLPVAQGGIPWKFVRNVWLGPVLWQRGLLRTLLGGDYDAVVFLGSVHYASTWLAALLLKARSTAVCMWGHGLLSRESGVSATVRETFYTLAGTHFIYSGRSVELMSERRRLSKRRLFQVNNALDHDVHVGMRRQIEDSESTYPQADLRLVFVGRLTERKRLDLALRAVADLRDQGVLAVLRVIGDGSERAKLLELAGELSIEDRVAFLGAVYDEDRLASHLYHADVCVSPGHVGLNAIHAMSFGTPVVTHSDLDRQSPEVEAIVPGVTGAFFEPGSSDDLVRVLLSLDVAGRRDRFRTECYAKVDGWYTPAYQVSVFEDGLRQAVSDRLPVG